MLCIGCYYRIVKATQQASVVSSACHVMSMSHLAHCLHAEHVTVHRLAAGNQIS